MVSLNLHLHIFPIYVCIFVILLSSVFKQTQHFTPPTPPTSLSPISKLPILVGVGLLVDLGWECLLKEFDEHETPGGGGGGGGL